MIRGGAINYLPPGRVTPASRLTSLAALRLLCGAIGTTEFSRCCRGEYFCLARSIHFLPSARQHAVAESVLLVDDTRCGVDPRTPVSAAAPASRHRNTSGRLLTYRPVHSKSGIAPM